MSYPWYSLNTQNLDVLNSINIAGNPGNDGEVIYNQSGVPVWKKIIGLVSKYTDNTDNVQDLSQSPAVPINFSTQDYDNNELVFNGDSFIFKNVGYYYVEFECLLSNSSAQNMISFAVNGTVIYGNFTPLITSSSSNVPFIMSTTLFLNENDELRILGEKYDNNPNYLRTNPLYGVPVTQLFVQRLTLS